MDEHAAALVIISCASLLTSCVDASLDSVPPASIEVSTVPTVTLGVASGDSAQEFFRIVTPFLMPDGRIVVPQSGTNSIRIFNPDGTLVRELGRQGQGPGEFAALAAAWNRGDTIEAYDWRLARITRFHPDGSIEVVNLRNPPQASMSAIPGIASEGWVFAGVSGAGAGSRDRISVTHFSRDGNLVGEVAVTHGMARFESNGSSGPEPLSPRARIRVAEGLVYIAETLTPTIQAFSIDGDTVHEITWRRETQLDPGSTVQAVIDSAVARAPSDQAESTRRRLEAAPIPTSLSAFWDFVVNDEGSIWIQSYDPLVHSAARGGLGRGSYLVGPVRGGEWNVITADGELLERVAVPRDLEIVQVTQDAVLGIAVDTTGVEQVRMHRLIRFQN